MSRPLSTPGLRGRVPSERIAEELRELHRKMAELEALLGASGSGSGDLSIEDQTDTVLTGPVLELEENFDATLSGSNVRLRDRPADDFTLSGSSGALPFRNLRISLTQNFEVTSITDFFGVSMLVEATLNGHQLSFAGAAFKGQGGALTWTGSQEVLLSIVNMGSSRYHVLAAQDMS